MKHHSFIPGVETINKEANKGKVNKTKYPSTLGTHVSSI